MIASACLAGLAMAALAVGLMVIPRRLLAELGRPPSARKSGAQVLIVLLVELATLVGLRIFGHALDGRAQIALVSLAGVLAAVVLLDVDYFIIPDLYVIVIVGLALAGPLAQTPVLALAGAAVCGGLLGLVRWSWMRWAGEEGLGLGDVKLAAALGALLGPIDSLTVVAAASGLAALTHLLMRRRAERDPDSPPPWMPLGAFLAATSFARVAWAVA